MVPQVKIPIVFYVVFRFMLQLSSAALLKEQVDLVGQVQYLDHVSDESYLYNVSEEEFLIFQGVCRQFLLDVTEVSLR